MCGITGFIDYRGLSSLPILKKQCDALSHRGPDGEGQALFELETAQAGLGHRRLSVIDLTEGGRQPMQYRQYSITFNGEIYNFEEIRADLIKTGAAPATGSDTETILLAFAEWGVECVRRFIGMFAFVIFDAEKQQLYCVRDRAGVKPFFYYWYNDVFLFGSELKALAAHPGFEKALDLNAAAAFMQYGYVPAPHCIFQHAHKLKPGHWLTFDIKAKSMLVQKYWDVYDYYNQPKLKIDFEEAKIETERLLAKAFNYRMVADVPVGVFLSGGYDSSCVTALLQKTRSEKIKTFTIGVGEPRLNEAPFAKKIAEYIGTEHTEYYCSEQDALRLVPDLPFYFDEPMGDSSAIPTTLVSQIARKEVKVALSADAGDEIFAGYSRYDFPAKYSWLNQIPRPAMQTLAAGMRNMPLHKIPFLNQYAFFSKGYPEMTRLFQNRSGKTILTNLMSEFLEDDVRDLFVAPVQKLDSYFDGWIEKEYADDVSSMMAADYQTYLADDILQKVDRASMSAGLEGREPFLDHHIIEWAARLPTGYKYREQAKKYILREIVHDHIPKPLLDRPKKGFSVPMWTWLKNDLRYLLDDYLDDRKIIQQGIFNPRKVRLLKNQFIENKNNHTMKIWYLLTFQMWLEMWGG